MLAKVNDTYSQFMHDDYKDEAKYINSLSDEDKIWLNTFLQGYYHQSKPAMDKLKFPIMLRRARYNQHRGAKADIFNKLNAYDLNRFKKVRASNDMSNFDNLILEEDTTAVIKKPSKRKIDNDDC